MFDNSTKFLITDQDAGMRLDIALVKLLPNLTRSNLKKIIELKQVKINNLIVDVASKKLKKDDCIEINLIPKQEIKILPAHIKLNIVHEDADILVVNKPAGMVVHPGAGNHNKTLVNSMQMFFIYNIGNRYRDKNIKLCKCCKTDLAFC